MSSDLLADYAKSSESMTTSTQLQTTATPLPTLSPNNNNQLSAFFWRYRVLLIFGGVCLVVLAAIIIGAYHISRRRKRFKKKQNEPQIYAQRQQASTTLTLMNTSDGSNSVNTTNNSSLAMSSATLISTNMNYALSVPGFLQLKIEDIIPRQHLASGGMGHIHICDITTPEVARRAQSSRCIAKMMKLNAAEQMVLFHQEVAIMYYLIRHPNVAKLIGYSDTPTMLVMRFYELGSLSKFIHGGIQQFVYTSFAVFNLVYGFTAFLQV